MTRTEYGAQLLSGLIYLHDTNAAFVRSFVADMAGVTPIRLVIRQCVGDVCGDWEVGV